MADNDSDSKQKSTAIVYTNCPNTCCVPPSQDKETAFLWLWCDAGSGPEHTRLTRYWRDFSIRAWQINRQNNFKSMYGSNSVVRVSNLINEIERAYKMMKKIDHLVITSHGYGEQELYSDPNDPLFGPYRDKGAILLGPYNEPVWQVKKSDDPNFIGATDKEDDIFKNKKYKELVKSIKDKEVCYLHLHTCYTGNGWTFLRKFAIDTKAVIHAYIDYVNVGYNWKGKYHVRFQQVIDSPSLPSGNRQPGLSKNDFYEKYKKESCWGIIEYEPGKFESRRLLVTTDKFWDNKGTMLLPGWQVRVRPHPKKANDVVIDKFYNSILSTYEFDENNPLKWVRVKLHKSPYRLIR